MRPHRASSATNRPYSENNQLSSHDKKIQKRVDDFMKTVNSVLRSPTGKLTFLKYLLDNNASILSDSESAKSFNARFEEVTDELELILKKSKKESNRQEFLSSLRNKIARDVLGDKYKDYVVKSNQLSTHDLIAWISDVQKKINPPKTTTRNRAETVLPLPSNPPTMTSTRTTTTTTRKNSNPLDSIASTNADHLTSAPAQSNRPGIPAHIPQTILTVSANSQQYPSTVQQASHSQAQQPMQQQQVSHPYAQQPAPQQQASNPYFQPPMQHQQVPYYQQTIPQQQFSNLNAQPPIPQPYGSNQFYQPQPPQTMAHYPGTSQNYLPTESHEHPPIGPDLTSVGLIHYFEYFFPAMNLPREEIINVLKYIAVSEELTSTNNWANPILHASVSIFRWHYDQAVKMFRSDELDNWKFQLIQKLARTSFTPTEMNALTEMIKASKAFGEIANWLDTLR